MFSYLSVCSGIEAATVAWEELGAEPVAFSEVDEFPSKVLATRWPRVLNMGDMNFIPDYITAGLLELPDVLVGGTPCQSFSISGVRSGLEDPRGKLALTYVEIADAIDRARAEIGKPPCVVVWENVPGVFTAAGNAFGCFLGLLAGEDCELQPPGGKWKNAGCVFGPKRKIAWRVLNSEFFGVPQRRKRVFVIASAREGFDPSEILFERQSEGVHPKARNRARKDVTTYTGCGGTTGLDTFTLMFCDANGRRADRPNGGLYITTNPRVATTATCSGPPPLLVVHSEPGSKPFVRKMMPVEVHRLQGFPDDHCKISWAGKPENECPDALQYKALGNSKAVPVVRWIGERLVSYFKTQV